MPIRSLAPDVIDQIAAGEVVERPASVVKELVENALDAGARHVRIAVEVGGVERVDVTDDGTGIASSELPLAVLRHHTSKLAVLEDLEGIRSYGFRGEALPSIAAVAHLRIASRCPGQAGGSALEVRGGRIGPVEACAMPPGTRVTVRALFAEVPARRKFLLAAAVEARRVVAVVERLALAAPETAFTLTVDGQETLRTGGSGNLAEVFADLYGVEVAEDLVPVQGRSDAGEVRGLVSRPGRDRGNRQWQLFVVGGRPVEAGRLRYPVEAAYQGRLLKGRFPVFCLRLEVPPGDVDVNVHPAKLEVRLRRERDVASLLHETVRAAVAPARTAPGGCAPAEPPAARGDGAAGFAEQEAASALFELDDGARLGLTPPAASDALPARPPEVMGQAGGLFIVAHDADGLYLFDQHAVHERIHYEQLGHQDVRLTQLLIAPLVVRLSPQQSQTLALHQGEMATYGFQVETFGDQDVLVRGVPKLFGREAPPALLTELLDALAAGGEEPVARAERVRREIAACRASVKDRDRLTLTEQESLVRQLLGCEEPRFCPHGRPTFLRMRYAELRERFLRR